MNEDTHYGTDQQGDQRGYMLVYVVMRHKDGEKSIPCAIFYGSDRDEAYDLAKVCNEAKDEFTWEVMVTALYDEASSD